MLFQLADLSRFLNQNYTSHQNYSIAIKLFDCLRYIDENLDSIAQVADIPGTSRTLRAPNGMAFHINFAQNGNDVKTVFSGLFEQIEHVAAFLLDKQNQLFINSFLNNIRDSDVGCLEARLHQAIDCVIFFESNGGIVALSDLMTTFWSQSILPKKLEPGSNDLEICTAALEFFQPHVTFQFTVMHEDQLVTLQWQHIKDFLSQHLEVDITQWLCIRTPDQLVLKPDKTSMLIFSQTRSEAQLNLAFVQSVLPESFHQNLQKARVIDDQGAFRFRLLHNQWHVLQQMFFDRIPETHYHRRWLIKTIRSDSLCFITNFVWGITRSEINKDPQHLRIAKKEGFCVYPDGVYKYPDKPEHFKRIDQIPGFSPWQSTTLVTNDGVLPNPFGHYKRQQKLVGFVFSLDEINHCAITGGAFTSDFGTRLRPYEFTKLTSAQEYYNQMCNVGERKLYLNIDDFSARLASSSQYNANEVLAKLRWVVDPNDSCRVCYFSDTLEARLLAQWYADITRTHLRAQSRENGFPWDAKYRVPIDYYNPESANIFQSYTLKQQQQDKQAAIDIIDGVNGYSELNHKLISHNYEILLAVDDVSTIIACTYHDRHLLAHIINNGYYHIAEALLAKDYTRAAYQPGHKWRINWHTALCYAGALGHHHLLRWLLFIRQKPDRRMSKLQVMGIYMKRLFRRESLIVFFPPMTAFALAFLPVLIVMSPAFIFEFLHWMVASKESFGRLSDKSLLSGIIVAGHYTSAVALVDGYMHIESTRANDYLNLAIRYGYTSIEHYLKSTGMEVDIKDMFIKALSQQDSKVVSWALEREPHLKDYQDAKSNTALHVMFNTLPILNLTETIVKATLKVIELLFTPSHINKKNSLGLTPLAVYINKYAHFFTGPHIQGEEFEKLFYPIMRCLARCGADPEPLTRWWLWNFSFDDIPGCNSKSRLKSFSRFKYTLFTSNATKKVELQAVSLLKQCLDGNTLTSQQCQLIKDSYMTSAFLQQVIANANCVPCYKERILLLNLRASQLVDSYDEAIPLLQF